MWGTRGLCTSALGSEALICLHPGIPERGAGGLRGVLRCGVPPRERGQVDAQSHQLHLGHFPEASVVFWDLEGLCSVCFRIKSDMLLRGSGAGCWDPMLGQVGDPEIARVGSL